MPGKIYIGTSSWAEKSLIDSGKFYPPEIKDTPSRLAYFAERFDLAEIDSTYYALPSRKNIDSWANAAPDGFRFNVKAYALFTQHPTPINAVPKSFREELPEELQKKTRLYEKDVPPEIVDELWRIFLRALQTMRDQQKLGAVLIDFPPWFVPSEPNREYIRRVRQHVLDDRIIVEFRNALWVADDESRKRTFALLRELECGFVSADEPQGLETSFPPVVGVTAPVAAVRFRGRNAERWEDKTAKTEEKLNWVYSDKELSEWVPRIRALANDADEVYVTFNTKAEDQSVVNAGKLQKLLGEKPKPTS